MRVESCPNGCARPYVAGPCLSLYSLILPVGLADHEPVTPLALQSARLVRDGPWLLGGGYHGQELNRIYYGVSLAIRLLILINAETAPEQEIGEPSTHDQALHWSAVRARTSATASRERYGSPPQSPVRRSGTVQAAMASIGRSPLRYSFGRTDAGSGKPALVNVAQRFWKFCFPHYYARRLYTANSRKLCE